MIIVDKINDTTFKVTIKGKPVTTHVVTVSSSYYEKLTTGQIPVVTLIEKSFEFLLQRESNTSILNRFDLPVIGHYFPEYESTIKKMFN